MKPKVKKYATTIHTQSTTPSRRTGNSRSRVPQKRGRKPLSNPPSKRGRKTPQESTRKKKPHSLKKNVEAGVNTAKAYGTMGY